MHFHILTLFPEMVMDGLGTSITGRAMKKGTISVDAINIRDYAQNKHGQVDDYPYGGGAGMVMQPGPVYRAYEAVKEQIEQRKKLDDTSFNRDETRKDSATDKGRQLRVVYMTPQGKVFDQTIARELAQEEDLVGTYESRAYRFEVQDGADYYEVQIKDASGAYGVMYVEPKTDKYYVYYAGSNAKIRRDSLCEANPYTEFAGIRVAVRRAARFANVSAGRQSCGQHGEGSRCAAGAV